MTVRLFADGTACAIFDEAPGGGDPLNPASLMNRPFVSPSAWSTSIYFHSNFNYYGVAAADLAKVVSHAAVPGLDTVTGPDIASLHFYGQTIAADHVLITHGLGYVPRFFVAQGGKMLPHGIPVQTDGPAKARFVCAYATTSQIILRDVGISTDTALAALSLTYQVLVFRSSVAEAGVQNLLIEPGNVIFGQGKFRAGQPHLRLSDTGDTPFSIALGKTAAVRNGALRTIPPNGSAIDFGTFTGSLAAPGYQNVAVGL